MICSLRRPRFIWTLTVLFTLAATPAFAQKGGKKGGGDSGGGTTDPGTIYMSQRADYFWDSGRDLITDHDHDVALNQDGQSPLALVEVPLLDPNQVNPSYYTPTASASWLVYGDDAYLDRWRLGLWRYDGEQLPYVRVCDSRIPNSKGEPTLVETLTFPEIRAYKTVTQQNGSQAVQTFEITDTAYQVALSYDYMNHLGVVWDKQDRFISVIGEDISHFTLQTDSQGRYWIDLAESDRKLKLYVFPIGGMDLEMLHSVDPDTGEWSWPAELMLTMSDAIEIVTVDSGSYFDWSPDGKHLVYLNSNQVRLVKDIDTQTPTTHLIWDNAQGYSIQWSPLAGNNRILFIGTVGQASGLCISQIDLDNPTPNATLAVRDSTKGAGSYAIRGAWSPEGKSILYSAVGQNSSGAAYNPRIMKYDTVQGRSSSFLNDALLQECRPNTSAFSSE